jgi:imipenem/basic amino acid-specific outer membrane pore
MQVMKWSIIALAVAAGSTQMAMASSQSESKGFVEDSSFDIFNRALYMNRDFRSGGVARKDQSYREEFGLGTRLLFSSGFTQGTVGVGVDAHTLSSVKIDSGKGRHSNGLFGTDSSDRGEDTQSELGGAIKFRISDTVLKYGNQMVDTPVFSTDDSRILPEVATGTFLTSNEIAGLEVNVGRFTALSDQEYTGRDSAELKSINFAGASYSFTDDFSGAIYLSDVEDVFKKKYLNLNYNLGLAAEQSLNFDFNIYKTDFDKRAYGESLDNTIWSLAAAYNVGAHTFTLAHQRSTGDSGYDYGIDGGGSIYLANSVQYSDFYYEDENSWQARYDLNMASFGVPGLSFMTRYVRGTDINLRDGGSSATERELDIEAKYVIQEGAAKDLSFRVRNAFYRADNRLDADINDVRLIVEYPLSVL